MPLSGLLIGHLDVLALSREAAAGQSSRGAEQTLGGLAGQVP